jgi:hypothetical protein
LWLGGLDRESLEAFNKGAVFAIADANGRSSGKVTLLSRKGLIGEGTVEGTTQAGALLQEAARSIPSDLKLRIGLDSSLGGEINSAKQAIQGINRIEGVPVPYSGEVHYLLGRVTAADSKALQTSLKSEANGLSGLKLNSCISCIPARDSSPWLIAKVLSRGLEAYGTRTSVHFNGLELLARSLNSGRVLSLTENNVRSEDFRDEPGNKFPDGWADGTDKLSQAGQAKSLPAEGSIGLFSPGRDELIPDSFGEPGETVTAAVKRLEAKLKSLLAVRLIKMTLNANSSRLKLAVSMLPEAGQEMIAEAFTPRSGITRERTTGLSQRLQLGTPFQFRVTNEESRPLYLTILSIDPTRGLTVLFPHSWRVSEDVTRLDAGQTLLIPNPAKDEFQLVAQAKGIGEVLIVASVSPLKKSLKNLQSLAEELKLANGPVVLGRDAQHSEDSVDVIGNLLDDLSGERGLGVASREVNTAEMAALSISFEVI